MQQTPVALVDQNDVVFGGSDAELLRGTMPKGVKHRDCQLIVSPIDRCSPHELRLLDFVDF
jgi:hypothetical protein